MSRPPKKKLGPQMQNLNEFGKFIVALGGIFRLNSRQVAELAGIDPSTLYKAAKVGGTMSREKVQQAWNVFVRLSPVDIDGELEWRFFNSAGYATDARRDESVVFLEEWMASPLANQLAHYFEQREKDIEEE